MHVHVRVHILPIYPPPPRLTSGSSRNRRAGRALQSVAYSSSSIWMNSMASWGELKPHDSCSKRRTLTSRRYSLGGGGRTTTNEHITYASRLAHHSAIYIPPHLQTPPPSFPLIFGLIHFSPLPTFPSLNCPSPRLIPPSPQHLARVSSRWKNWCGSRLHNFLTMDLILSEPIVSRVLSSGRENYTYGRSRRTCKCTRNVIYNTCMYTSLYMITSVD